MGIACGAGPLAIGGDVSGSVIITGDQNTVKPGSPTQQEE